MYTLAIISLLYAIAYPAISLIERRRPGGRRRQSREQPFVHTTRGAARLEQYEDGFEGPLARRWIEAHVDAGKVGIGDRAHAAAV